MYFEILESLAAMMISLSLIVYNLMQYWIVRSDIMFTFH